MLSRQRNCSCIAKIRVIVPAYEEKVTLRLCLKRVQQELNEFSNEELVVISYKSDVEGIEHQRICLKELTHALNAGEARNLGAENAGEKILVFIDADVLIEPGSLKKLITPILNGNADATVGNYSTDIKDNSFFQNYKKVYINNAYSNSCFIENEFWTAFAAIKAPVFWDVGGFSERFKFKGGEDTEIGMRLTKKKYKIFAVANACGRHLKTYDFISLVKNDFDKGTRTVMLSLSERIKLCHNRHAKENDQLAVVVACLLSFIILLGAFMPILLASLLPVFFAYFFLRKKFLINCSRYGTAFFIKSFFTCIVLDVVRALALINGVSSYFMQKLSKH